MFFSGKLTLTLQKGLALTIDLERELLLRSQIIELTEAFS